MSDTVKVEQTCRCIVSDKTNNIVSTLLFLRNLTTCDLADFALAPYPHKERLELHFIQLLECGLHVALIGCQNSNDVLSWEIAFGAQLIVLCIQEMLVLVSAIYSGHSHKKCMKWPVNCSISKNLTYDYVTILPKNWSKNPKRSPKKVIFDLDQIRQFTDYELWLM